MPNGEDELDVGRAEPGPGRGRLVAVVLLLTLGVGGVGWLAWHGDLDQPARPRRAAGPTTRGHVPPARVPYLRSGALVEPDGTRRDLPDGAWTDAEQLPDGRLVLAEQGSVTVLARGRRRTYPTYAWARSLVHTVDRAAVAWRRPDGAVMVAGPGGPSPVRARIQRPECVGLRVHERVEPRWRRCDRDGHLLSADHGLVALVGAHAVTLAPPADITAGAGWDLTGALVDATWEDDRHLLVVVATAEHTLLQRISVDAPPETLVTAPRYDPRRPVLVLP